jgi:hypothetical protein
VLAVSGTLQHPVDSMVVSGLPATAVMAPATPTFDDATLVRILRWKFRREDETVVCEMGLTGHDSAYQLRIDPASDPTGATTERFDDAFAVFARHAMIEHVLIKEGWSLDGFESESLRH